MPRTYPPGATDSWAYGLNDAGVVVGESGGRAVRWTGGRIADLGVPDLGRAVDVNRRGVVVGESFGPAGGRAFRWDRGTVTELPPLPGDTHSFVTGVNDRGEVLGASSGDRYRPVLWRPDGTVVDLAALTGLVRVTDLDDHGRYVGEQLYDGMKAGRRCGSAAG
jgi:uncharacterized membrane protein